MTRQTFFCFVLIAVVSLASFGTLSAKPVSEYHGKLAAPESRVRNVMRQNSYVYNKQLKEAWTKVSNGISRGKPIEITFTTIPDGSMFDINVAKSCGNADVDKICKDAVQKMIPPKNFNGEKAHRYYFRSLFSNIGVNTYFIRQEELNAPDAYLARPKI